MKKIKEIIITALITLGLVTVAGTFIINFFTTNEPILFSQNPCITFIDLSTDKPMLQFNLENRADTSGYAKVCLQSDVAVLVNSDGELLKNYCFSDTKIHPIESGLHIEYKSKIAKADYIPKEIDNLTIKIDVECSYKIWGFVNKGCNDLLYTCNYNHDGSYLRLNS